MFQRISEISKILLIRFLDLCFDFSFILTSLSTFLIFPLHLGNDTAVRSFPIGCNPDVAQKQTSASRWLVVVCMGGNRGLKVHLRCKSLHLWDVYADSVQQHRHCSTMYLGQQCSYIKLCLICSDSGVSMEESWYPAKKKQCVGITRCVGNFRKTMSADIVHWRIGVNNTFEKICLLHRNTM